MTEDERRNKQHAANLFYLDLWNTHGNNFEEMLTPDELAIWNIFPDFHKRLMTSWGTWELRAKNSLQYFESSTLIALGVSMREVAWGKLNHYRRLAVSCKKVLSLDELVDFLYPLIEIKGDFLKQEVIRAIREETLSPIELQKMDSEEWEQYQAGNCGVNILWLEKQDSEHLKQCAAVWRRYLLEPVQAMTGTGNTTDSPEPPIPQKKGAYTLEKEQERRAIYRKVVDEMGVSTKKSVLDEEAAKRAGCTARMIREALRAEK